MGVHDSVICVAINYMNTIGLVVWRAFAAFGFDIPYREPSEDDIAKFILVMVALGAVFCILVVNALYRSGTIQWTLNHVRDAAEYVCNFARR